ncbi:MAG: hypothetical protein RBU37_01890 [Myxococcota bacterium]|jgi:hypothetical protein|nr:hypothetical protein [Myxococcota bacterium]
MPKVSLASWPPSLTLLVVLSLLGALLVACDTDEEKTDALCTTNAECEKQYGSGWMCGEYQGKMQCVTADGPDAFVDQDSDEEVSYCTTDADCTTKHGPGWFCQEFSGRMTCVTSDEPDAFVDQTSDGELVESCPDCVACGDDKCQKQSEYCEVFSGGAEPTQSFTCTAMPAACGGTLSCACLESGGATCTENEGEFTVHFMAP